MLGNLNVVKYAVLDGDPIVSKYVEGNKVKI
jgi:hypothetical protein